MVTSAVTASAIALASAFVLHRAGTSEGSGDSGTVLIVGDSVEVEGVRVGGGT